MDFFAIAHAFQSATPEKKLTPPCTETPEKLSMSSEGPDSPESCVSSLSDASESHGESATDEEDEQVNKKKKKKEKKKKKKKGKKKKEKKKEKKQQKKKNTWHQGRDKMKDDLSQTEKNDILSQSYEKHIGAWKKACPQLEHIIVNTQEVAGVTIFQLGCDTCMAYVGLGFRL